MSIDLDYLDAVKDKCIFPGINPSCPVCQKVFGMTPQEFHVAYKKGEIFEEGSFSWQSCDGCDSSLGGDRHSAHILDKKTGETSHIEICSDCLCFFANGDIPQNWGGKI